ncbi:TonB-dependent receptor domain-containing protein [Beggiatoa alba]|nr:TonB-dependent receptor [Beggiatoa alba]
MLPLLLCTSVTSVGFSDDNIELAVVNSDVELATVDVWSTSVQSSSQHLADDSIAMKQADHLSDLMRNIPGVDIGGSHSVNQRINIRGIDETDLDIRLDGAPQAINMFHHVGNLLLNADILKAVEIDVGATSVINNGLGGSVRFETKDAQDLLQAGQTVGARVQGSYASNKSLGFSLTGYGKYDKLDALVYGYNVNRDNPKDGNGDTMMGNDGTIGDILFKVGYDLTDYQRLEFSADRYEDEGLYSPRPNFGTSANVGFTKQAVFPTEFSRNTYTLNHELDIGNTLYLKTTAYYNELDLWRSEDASLRNAVISGLAKTKGINLLAQTVINTESLKQQLTYGTEYRQQSSDYSRVAQATGNPATNVFAQEEAKSYAAYIEDRVEFSNGLAITPGLRYDYYSRDIARGEKQDWDEFSTALAAEYPLSTAFTVRVSTTESFKGPELSEIFTGVSDYSVLNTDLRPETARNNQISLLFQEKRFLGADRFAANLTVFRTDIKDYMTVIYEGSSLAYDANIGDVEINGFEFSVNYDIGDFGVLASYARSDSEITTFDPDDSLNKQPLDNEVGDSISLELNYEVPTLGLKFAWDSMFVRPEDGYTLDSSDKKSYDVHNISARWQLQQSLKGLVLTFGVDNLFDEVYTSHASSSGIARGQRLDDLEPGRNFKLTATYTF